MQEYGHVSTDDIEHFSEILLLQKKVVRYGDASLKTPLPRTQDQDSWTRWSQNRTNPEDQQDRQERSANDKPSHRGSSPWEQPVPPAETHKEKRVKELEMELKAVNPEAQLAEANERLSLPRAQVQQHYTARFLCVKVITFYIVEKIILINLRFPDF